MLIILLDRADVDEETKSRLFVQTIPSDLAVRGYKNQLCVDFSTVVVNLMSARHEQEKGIEWKWADVRNMTEIADGSIDVAFDKGTLDAMISGSPWDPPDIVKQNTGQYINEVRGSLKCCVLQLR